MSEEKVIQNLENMDMTDDSVETKYNKLILGFHTSKEKKGIIDPLRVDTELLKSHGFKSAAQIFTQVPQTTVFTNIEPAAEIGKFLDDTDTKLLIHSPYAINDFWKKNDLTKLTKSLENSAEFAAATKNFTGIVIHLPKMIPEDVVTVIKNRSVNSVLILLENHAYKPGMDSYELPSRLNKLTNLLIEAKTPNWGYCIDTAHLFVCISEVDRGYGYKIEERAAMERWLGELTEETRSRIKAWHLNGSVNEASSHNDKHAIPIFGSNHLLNTAEPDRMWGEHLLSNEIKKDGLDKHMDVQIDLLQDTSLIPVMKHAMHYNIPVILEINRGNSDDVEGCLKIFARLEKEINKDPDF
jgi:endonuclease IV